MRERRSVLTRISEKLPLLIFILCVIQPVLDIAGYWQQTLGISNTVTMLLRMLLLGSTLLLGFLLSDRKRIYVIAAVILMLLTAGHIYACTRVANGYQSPITDQINLVRIYFLPLTALCFITFFRKNPDVFPAVIRGLSVDLLLIAAVQLLSTVTGTDPHTYSVDGTGILGWFLWTNSQSAILAMSLPVLLCWALRRWEKSVIPLLLLTAVAEATLYVLAPRLAYASMVAAGLGMAICLLIVDRRRWPQALAIALVTCLFLAAFPLSPTYKRLNDNDSRMEQTQERIKQLDIKIEYVTEPETEETGESSEKPNSSSHHGTTIRIDEQSADKIEQLYRSQDIIWSMVERFGRDRVFEIYQYSLDPFVLSNTRLMKIRFCELLMAESGKASHLFGLNLKEMTFQRYNKDSILVTDNYDVENDFHGIYFLTGIVGLVLMIAFLLYFGLRALFAVLRRPKQSFTLPMCAFAISYVLGLIHAYFTASVLRRNNASFYLAIVLAALWYLSSAQRERTGRDVK